MTVYREDFSKEIGRVDEAGEKYKAEKILAHPLLQPVETHVDRLGLLRSSGEPKKSQDQSRIFRYRRIEGEGGYVAVDGEDLGEEVGGVDEAGEKDKA